FGSAVREPSGCVSRVPVVAPATDAANATPEAATNCRRLRSVMDDSVTRMLRRLWPLGPLGRLAIFARHPDGPCEAAHFEAADEPVAEVELPPAQAVAGGGREGVVVVVPPFAEAE